MFFCVCFVCAVIDWIFRSSTKIGESKKKWRKKKEKKNVKVNSQMKTSQKEEKNAQKEDTGIDVVDFRVHAVRS
jgi:hypothetical protein